MSVNFIDEKVIELYLKEYESLRDEIFERFESQRQAFNYLMALIGAVGALIAALKENLPSLAKYSLFLPILAAPLGFIFFDNEIIIWSIVKYIQCNIKPEVSKLIGKKRIFQIESRGSIYLFGSRRHLHLLLSMGRWLLFFVPLICPLVYALWDKLLWKNGRLWTFFWLFFFLLDCFLLLIMIWAVAEVVKMRRRANASKY